MRIPIVMSHGTHRKPVERYPMSREYFGSLLKIARDLGFESIDYGQLAAWRAGTGGLPARPVMFDFDHPEIVMCEEVFEAMSEHGFKGNLFINTGWLDDLYKKPLLSRSERGVMTWDEIGALKDAGWHMGAHTVTHPDLSELSVVDPTGERVREELVGCNETMRKYLGETPVDFAYTGTSWSTAAEREVMKLYRFGRLWIVGAHYNADGKRVRYADLVGAPGADEADGGPPVGARYITRETHAYRLPSMEVQGLIYTPEAFEGYLRGSGLVDV